CPRKARTESSVISLRRSAPRPLGSLALRGHLSAESADRVVGHLIATLRAAPARFARPQGSFVRGKRGPSRRSSHCDAPRRDRSLRSPSAVLCPRKARTESSVISLRRSAPRPLASLALSGPLSAESADRVVGHLIATLRAATARFARPQRSFVR